MGWTTWAKALLGLQQTLIIESETKFDDVKRKQLFLILRREVLCGACAYAFRFYRIDFIFMKGESQDTYLTFGENSVSKASSVEEEFNVKNGGSYVTNNRQTDVFFHYKISDNFPRYVVRLVRSAKTKSETCIKKKKFCRAT